jgi:anaerobic magnesium-protoporphyrin IX monomethyl ester cyclase
MNKKIDLERYYEHVQAGRDAGLAIGTSLVFGYPQETKETIQATLQTCRDLEIYPTVGFLLPLPGSEMYVFARKNGHIDDEEAYLMRIGDRQDIHVNLTRMTSEALFNTVREGLIKLKTDLGIDLGNDAVIKTGKYRTAKKQNEYKDKPK